MTLYLYKIKTGTGGASAAPVMTLENVVSYTDSKAFTEGNGIYGPFAEDCELSSKPDCSETLRADWRKEHPSQDVRIDELEALVAELLFGGEGV